MMQSSPLNLRRVVIWIGRLLLGGIFIYAGYSKIFLPNSNLWPYLFLKFSVSLNLTNFATQVEAFKMLPAWAVQFVAHTLPFAEISLGLLVLIGWRLRIWSSLLTVLMLGFTFAVLRAYILHMDINCGCFATPQPVNLQKILEDAALSGLAVLMTLFAFQEAGKPHPWSASNNAAAAPSRESVL
jgi:uncharacterized membrane protein YphA (DoxX/SURF4 family)